MRGHAVTEVAVEVEVACPRIADAGAIWRIARDSAALDLNSSYAYVLLCRDFAGTSAVATTSGEVVGFVVGYRRPSAPDTLMVWQVAVIERLRGRRVASTMLDALLHWVEPTYLETTISPDNGASRRLFTGLASRWAASWTMTACFEPAVFPDPHAAEDLLRIGPLPPAGAPAAPAAPPSPVPGARSAGGP